MCLVIEPDYLCGIDNQSMGNLFVNFGENRNSDNLFVQHLERPSVFNSPTVEGEIFTEESYEARKYFRYDEYYVCAEYVIGLIQSYNDKVVVRQEVAASDVK